MVLIQKELKNAYLGEYTPPLPNTWPCPAWFHIPTKDEWVNIINAWVTLWAWTLNNGGGNNASVYLKLPASWKRYYASSDVNNDRWWYYWSVTPYSGYGWIHINIFLYYSWTVYPEQTSEYRADGYPIRPFKDSAKAPDSSWNTIYAWTGSAWIFQCGI